MMRFLIGFFLPLCLLLSGVQLHGALIPGKERRAQVFFENNGQSSRASNKVKAVEVEEDDESDCSRKETADNAFASLFCTRASSPLFYSTVRLPFCEHISFLATFKFIVFRVIRI